MKLRTKIAISIVVPVVFMLLLPLLEIKLFPEFAGIGLWFVSFFAVNPLIVISLSFMAGTDVKKLWWIPITISAVFPLLFGVAICDFVWDLYFYSAIYLFLGIITMLITHFVKNAVSKKSK